MLRTRRRKDGNSQKGKKKPSEELFHLDQYSHIPLPLKINSTHQNSPHRGISKRRNIKCSTKTP